VDEMLSNLGGKQAMQLKITNKVKRVNNQLVFD